MDIGIPRFVEDAVAHSYKRKMYYSKKITQEMLRKEVEVSQVIGEVSGVERVLDLIIKNKNNPDFSIEDLEASMHLFISNGLNYCSKAYHGVEGFPLERVLEVHGYLNKKE